MLSSTDHAFLLFFLSHRFLSSSFSLAVVPPVVILMVKSPVVDSYDLSSLRVQMSGAAPLTEEIGTALAKKYPQLLTGQGYGLSESCTVIAVYDPSVGKGNIPQASAGTLVPNIE